MKIIISGASFGIGRYLTQSLIRKSHQVWSLARSLQPLQELAAEMGTNLSYSECDVSSYQLLSEVKESVKKHWGKIDAIICCAGVQGAIGETMNTDPMLWESTIRINLVGTYNTIRAFFDLFGNSSDHKKVLCFSGGGAASPRCRFSAYGASKAGVVRLTETLAEEWKNLPIDINAIAPGAINTRLTEDVRKIGSDIAGQDEYQKAIQLNGSNIDSMEKVSELVSYLLSKESNGISGKLIHAVWDPWQTFNDRKNEIQHSDIYTLRRIVPEDRGKDW